MEKPSVKERIERIKDYISLKGFQYPEGMIENFYLSLKSKPFVILAGASGTGKTQLVRLFAEAVGAVAEEETDEENQLNRRNRYKFMPVCPDRSDSAALFGYVNLRGKFVPGTIIDFLRQASCDPEYPYFLCLDGMNPARAENYLRDFLSVFETRRWSGGKIVTDEIPVDPSAEEKYKKLGIPENLYVIGTVNTDETTFPVSKKSTQPRKYYRIFLCRSDSGFYGDGNDGNGRTKGKRYFAPGSAEE